MPKYRISFWENEKNYPEHDPVTEYIITSQNENAAIEEATTQFSEQFPDLDLKDHVISSENS